jgi:hypothetical protein
MVNHIRQAKRDSIRASSTLVFAGERSQMLAQVSGAKDRCAQSFACMLLVEQVINGRISSRPPCLELGLLGTEICTLFLTRPQGLSPHKVALFVPTDCGSNAVQVCHEKRTLGKTQVDGRRAMSSIYPFLLATRQWNLQDLDFSNICELNLARNSHPVLS